MYISIVGRCRRHQNVRAAGRVFNADRPAQASSRRGGLVAGPAVASLYGILPSAVPGAGEASATRTEGRGGDQRHSGRETIRPAFRRAGEGQGTAGKSVQRTGGRGGRTVKSMQWALTTATARAHPRSSEVSIKESAAAVAFVHGAWRRLRPPRRAGG